MTSEELRGVIAKAVYEILDPADHRKIAEVFAKDDFSFDEITESSMVLTELCFQIEETLSIEIETTDLFDNPRLSGFIENIQSKLAKA
jgi:acyl carrier protein